MLLTKLGKRNRINFEIVGILTRENQTHKKVLNHVCRFHIRFRSTLWKSQLPLGISVPEKLFHITNNLQRQNRPFAIAVNDFVRYGLTSVLLSELADRFKLRTALSGFRMFHLTIN